MDEPDRSASTLGPFRLRERLGAGGMGEVWRALDTRLGREVAIKLLPEQFAADPERVARFEREARALAALSHPNVAGIHEVGHGALSGGAFDTGGAAREVHYLVMELAPATTLADRLAGGALPLREALVVARDLAEGLAAAHERGIVHRDLKPANVAVDDEGRAKVLDFGLAKALAEAAPASGPPLENSPTLTAAHGGAPTATGTILGTAPYLSPEQARGRAVDARTDVWAFGCVLYEMLAGSRAFAGESIPDLLVGILTREPDWSALPESTPPRLLRLLRRCLAKERRQRLHSLADAGLEIEDLLAEGAGEGGDVSLRPPPAGVSTATRSKGRGWLARFGWAAGGFAGAGLLATLFAPRLFPTPATAPVTFELLPPPGEELSLAVERNDLAVSPDGRAVAFVTEGRGTSTLWVRRLAAPVPVAVPDSDGAGGPMWSPDGDALAFFSRGRLRRSALAAGVPQAPRTLCTVAGAPGGAWGDDDTIVLTQVFAAKGVPEIRRVSASDGRELPPPAPLDAANRAKVDAEIGWRRFPELLPGGRILLYHAHYGPQNRSYLFADDWSGAPSRPLFAFDSRVVYHPASRRLLYVREGQLLAQPFAVERLRLEGAPELLASELPAFVTGWSPFAVGGDTLAYVAGTNRVRLVWFDRQGRREDSGLPVDSYEAPRLAPDGRRAVVSRGDKTGATDDMWLVDLDRRVSNRLTSGPGYKTAGTWTPDGREVLFTPHGHISDASLHRLTLRGGEPTRLPLPETGYLFRWADDVSPDGRWVLYTQSGRKAEGEREDVADLWRAPIDGSGPPVVVVRTPFGEGEGVYSPDGTWVAFSSDESGRGEIYLMPVAGGPRVRVSRDGGRAARWPRRGEEIVFVGANGAIMGAPVHREGGTWTAGEPVTLFHPGASTVRGGDVTADGQRFLLAVPDVGTAAITVVVGWRR